METEVATGEAGCGGGGGGVALAGGFEGWDGSDLAAVGDIGSGFDDIDRGLSGGGCGINFTTGDGDCAGSGGPGLGELTASECTECVSEDVCEGEGSESLRGGGGGILEGSGSRAVQEARMERHAAGDMGVKDLPSDLRLSSPASKRFSVDLRLPSGVGLRAIFGEPFCLDESSDTGAIGGVCVWLPRGVCCLVKEGLRLRTSPLPSPIEIRFCSNSVRTSAARLLIDSCLSRAALDKGSGEWFEPREPLPARVKSGLPGGDSNWAEPRGMITDSRLETET